MEKIRETRARLAEQREKADEFLKVTSNDGSGSGSGYAFGDGYGYGSGYGDGDGDGDGDGYGDGDGSGYGDGYGDGDGSGDGDGYGSGDGVEVINGEPVSMVDDIQTILRVIRGNVAKGAILNDDLTLTPCYVVKQGNLFAHGKTLREAQDALTSKLFDDMPEEERIAEFVKAHPAINSEHLNSDFFEWHHRLTGSCLMGRETFAKNHGVDLDEKSTVLEFIEMTEKDYGGGTIRKLREAYA